MKVPFLDLKAQYAGIKDEIDSAIREVLDSCAFAGGPFVERFEKEWAAYCGVKYAIGVGSGTEALWLALSALGVGQGDEVITVPNTFIATAEAISFAGAKAVFVDVDEAFYTMNPALLEAAITSRTRAIIPVHLFGQTVNMDPIIAAARDKGLFIIEDASQAHGAQYKGKKAGSLGDVGCFSFYPGKNLGAYGEAGAVVTNVSDIAEKVRILRDHGQRKKYYHEICGWNGRMDGLQSAVLSAKLKHLDQWNHARRKVALQYRELLADEEGLGLPAEAASIMHVYHVFAIRTKKRDQLMEDLLANDIHCSIHYPLPIHLQAAYASLNLEKGKFPVAEKSAAELVSLPIYPELSDAQVVHVVKSIRSSRERCRRQQEL